MQNKIKPILFNTEMVRAILDGRKTQTRRVIRPQPRGALCYCIGGWKPGRWHYMDPSSAKAWDAPDTLVLPKGSEFDDERLRTWTAPINADDLLYVRETWNYGFVESSDREYANDVWFEPSDRKSEGSYLRTLSRYWYKADADDEKQMAELGGYWRPSIHMPKEAARIWLLVKKVRVEPLKVLTTADAKAEGVECTTDNSGQMHWYKFIQLWDSTLNADGVKKYGWETNPWVWVIEFERADPPKEGKA